MIQGCEVINDRSGLGNAAFGADRPGAVCRELTKPYEQVVRGSLSELAQWAAESARGEITNAVDLHDVMLQMRTVPRLIKPVLERLGSGFNVVFLCGRHLASRERLTRRELRRACLRARCDRGCRP